jgi:hypothetical protein
MPACLSAAAWNVKVSREWLVVLYHPPGGFPARRHREVVHTSRPLFSDNLEAASVEEG